MLRIIWQRGREAEAYGSQYHLIANPFRCQGNSASAVHVQELLQISTV